MAGIVCQADNTSYVIRHILDLRLVTGMTHMWRQCCVAVAGPWMTDVLRRLTRDTFSEHTMLVTVERVRGGRSAAGMSDRSFEARHNSQMMVVSKLINDLATRQQPRR